MHRIIALLCLMITFSRCAGETAWEAVKLPDSVGKAALRGVFFLDAKTGWVVGDKGLCLSTRDGGKTWQSVATGSNATLRCVRFKDANVGYICGDGDPAAPKPMGHVVMGHPMTSGTLLSTTDGGRTWTPHWIPANFEIHAVEVSTAPEIQVTISGVPDHLDGDITRSSDGGKTWSSRRCYRALMDIRAIDAKNWVAVGTPVCVGFMPTPKEETYTAKNCRAFFSKDGGKTWSVAKGTDSRAVLYGAAARTGAAVVACGAQGDIVRSEDMGQNWTAATSGSKETLRAVTWAGGAANQLVAVGDKGTILTSVDAGKTWKVIESNTQASLLAISPAGEDYFVAGTDGTLLRATGKKLP